MKNMAKIITLTILLLGVVIMCTACFNRDKNGDTDAFSQTDKPNPGDQIAIIQTSMGDITVRLFPEHAPKTVENFTTHARNGYYDGVPFHRVIDNFMIQTGCPFGNGTGGESIWGGTFNCEVNFHLNNLRGALAMANRGPNTNGSQFFIVQNNRIGNELRDAFTRSVNDANATTTLNSRTPYNLRERYPLSHLEYYIEHGGTPHLDTPGIGTTAQHTVFAQVIDGMDVVDAIAAVRTGANDRPLESINIITIVITEYEHE